MRLLDTIAIGNSNEISLNVKPAIDRLSADPRPGSKFLVVLLRARSVAAPRSSIPWNSPGKGPSLLVYTGNPSDASASNRPSAGAAADSMRRHRRTPPHRQQHGIYRRRNRHQQQHRKHQKRFNSNYSRLLRECRRHELRVDFGELNWQDWILAPLAYDAYFCQGQCPWPMQDTHNTTNHAIVQSLISEVSRGAIPQPCCVPAELSSISLLYVDWTERVVAKNYPDMVVDSCGCR